MKSTQKQKKKKNTITIKEKCCQLALFVSPSKVNITTEAGWKIKIDVIDHDFGRDLNQTGFTMI